MRCYSRNVGAKRLNPRRCRGLRSALLGAVAEDEREAPVEGDLVEEVKGWSSLWADLLLVEMTLHTRSQMPDEPVNLFARRAMWEAAVTAYWRTANTGRRQKQQVTELLTAVGAEAEKTHDEVERWRNQHVAHRVDELRETVDVRVVVDPDDSRLRGTVIRVAPVLGPEEEGSDLAERFEAHARALKALAWQARIRPLEAQILNEHADDGEALLEAAKTAKAPESHFVVTISPS
jgi:hypothetical protein